jgi:hypothetical protein
MNQFSFILIHFLIAPNLIPGYFSVVANNLLSLGFAPFISKDSKIKMVINNLLSENDKGIILKGRNTFGVIR